MKNSKKYQREIHKIKHRAKVQTLVNLFKEKYPLKVSETGSLDLGVKLLRELAKSTGLKAKKYRAIKKRAKGCLLRAIYLGSLKEKETHPCLPD